MEITKNKLFYSILAFMLFINILVAFNLNQFYIRAVLAFLFIVLVPGLLIMLMMKIREVGFWKYFVYTVGLSISFIMFAGLAVNWILPWLHITDRPLSLWPILICFNIFLIAFWIISKRRNKDLKPINIQFPKLDALNTIMFTIPIIFVFMATIGSFLLNNYGPNQISLLIILGIVMYILSIIYFHKKLNKNVLYVAIFFICLSLLLMHSLRGGFLSTTDAAWEYSFYKFSSNAGIWAPNQSNSAYNSMLSITVLPKILNLFIGCSDFFILKLIYPLIFSIIGVVLILIFNNYFNLIQSFLASLFFILQPTITRWTFLPPRQELAFLFFALILLIFLKKNISKNEKFLFILFGSSMAVSHYSTTYIALGMLVLTFIIFLILKFFIKLNYSQLIRGIKLVSLVFLFVFLWYFQITTLSTGLISVGKSTFEGFSETLIFDDPKGAEPLVNGFNIPFISSSNRILTLKDYNNEFRGQNDQKLGGSLSPKRFTFKDYKFFKLHNYFSKAEKWCIIFGGLFILLGILYSFYLSKKNPGELMLLALALSFLISSIVIIISPTTLKTYNIDRVYQQGLIILSLMFVRGFLFIFRKRKIFFILISIFLISYFLIFTRIEYSFLGGENTQLRFENIGKDYDIHYTSNMEIKSSSWLFKSLDKKSTINTGDYARFKIYQANNFDLDHFLKREMHPMTIKRENYVYSSRLNTVDGLVSKYYHGNLLTFQFPTKFLNENKNKIYANGGSEIFK
jgi:uncharacterized membrane protein